MYVTLGYLKGKLLSKLKMYMRIFNANMYYDTSFFSNGKELNTGDSIQWKKYWGNEFLNYASNDC